MQSAQILVRGTADLRPGHDRGIEAVARWIDSQAHGVEELLVGPTLDDAQAGAWRRTGGPILTVQPKPMTWSTVADEAQVLAVVGGRRTRRSSDVGYRWLNARRG